MRRRDKNEDVLSWVELFLYKQCEILFCTRLVGVEATLTIGGYHLHIYIEMIPKGISFNKSEILMDLWQISSSFANLDVNVHSSLMVELENCE